MNKCRCKRIVLIALVACAISFFLVWSGEQDPQAGWIVIENVRVFDGQKMLPRATVVVNNGRIQAIGPSLAVPVGAEVIDGRGKTLLPGLIDSHVHLWSRDTLRQTPVFGVTAMADMFTSVEFAAGIKKDQEAPGPHPQAFIVSPRTLVTKAGGHGTQYGLQIPTLENAAQARSFVDARIAEGSDFIKIIYDDGHVYNFHLPTLSREEMAAVVAATHARGKMAIVHAGSLKMCREALEAGADGLAHLNFDDAFDPDFGQLAAAKKAFVIPTLSVLASMSGDSGAAGIVSDARLAPYLKDNDLQGLTGVFSFKTSAGAYTAAERTLKQLHEYRVPILAGTDAPNPGTAFGPSLHGELALLVKAGLTPSEALQSATSIPADIFGMKGRGRIAPGFIADLVLVDGDPGRDIDATRAIVAVWREGLRVDRAAYRTLVERERAARKSQSAAAPPSGLGEGLISDFAGGKIASNFGQGWMVSTDSYLGGKSKAELSLVGDGVAGSQGSLRIEGTIAEAGAIRWAGAMFSPGTSVMAPANLSVKKALVFWAKGNGRSFAVMVYAQSLGFIPKVQSIAIGPEWREFVCPFEKFGLAGFDITAILIGAVNLPGDFWLQIDNVRLR